MNQKYDLQKAQIAYGEFLQALGFDWKSNPHMKDTPKRVSKSFIEDIFKGCYDEHPNIQAFSNEEYKYDGIVFQGNITLNSCCSHHILPFIGKAHVAYIPSPTGKVIGLSKLNRIVEHFARRPQVQENLTMQIHNCIDSICEENLGVAVLLEANHMCACVRGVKHDSTMKTSKLSKAFLDQEGVRREFYFFIESLNK